MLGMKQFTILSLAVTLIDTLVADELSAAAMKRGGRLVKHAWSYWLPLAQGCLTRSLFGAALRRLATHSMPRGSSTLRCC
jgi:hypothetical protein